MKKKRMFFLSLLLLVCFPLISPLSVPTVKADWHLVNSGDFQRDLVAGWIAHQWNSLTTDYRLRYDWTSGIVSVDFCIVDSTNYQRLEDGLSFYCYCLHEDVTSGDYSWNVVSGGTWYVVWIGLLTQIHTDWYLYEWWDPPSFSLSSPSSSYITLNPGGTTSITMSLYNTGEETGEASVSISSGSGIVSATVTPNSPSLNGGSHTTITVSITALQVGSVNLQVTVYYQGSYHDSQSISVTVISALGPPGPGGIPFLAYIIPIVAIVIALGVGIFLYQRHQQSQLMGESVEETSPTPPPLKEIPSFCSECGTPLRGRKFCGQCGKSLEEME